jgi:Bacterial PH domain
LFIALFLAQKAGGLHPVQGFLGLVLAFMSWIWRDTRYRFKLDRLEIRSGPFRTNIPLPEIRYVESGIQPPVGQKFGLAIRGMRLHYGKFDEVFISPFESEEFLADLQSRNPDVKIQSG